MTTGVVGCRKRKIGSGTKVKTGCATCRLRKVKCDEDKPFCQRCVKTGRSCDGYGLQFRPFDYKPLAEAVARIVEADSGQGSIRPAVDEITSRDIDVLKRYFSTKSILNVDLDCDEEARQILQASLTESSIRHAVSSLKLLREDLETTGDNLTPDGRHTQKHLHGLQQYSEALGGVATDLASPSRPDTLKSAIHCCQIFVSIEQVQKNYTVMAKHIIRGLSIVRECQPRSFLDAHGNLMSSPYRQLPLLDVFIIKLFAAPCKFAETPSATDACATESPVCLASTGSEAVDWPKFRKIAPDLRTELVNVATSTLGFLGLVSQIDSMEVALRLMKKRAALLDSLKSWLNALDFGHTCTESEPVSVSFLRIFHSILRTVLLGTLAYQPILQAEIEAENYRLLKLANGVTERVKDYKVCSGSGMG